MNCTLSRDVKVVCTYASRPSPPFPLQVPPCSRTRTIHSTLCSIINKLSLTLVIQQSTQNKIQRSIRKNIYIPIEISEKQRLVQNGLIWPFLWPRKKQKSKLPIHFVILFYRQLEVYHMTQGQNVCSNWVEHCWKKCVFLCKKIIFKPTCIRYEQFVCPNIFFFNKYLFPKVLHIFIPMMLHTIVLVSACITLRNVSIIY